MAFRIELQVRQVLHGPHHLAALPVVLRLLGGPFQVEVLGVLRWKFKARCLNGKNTTKRPPKRTKNQESTGWFLRFESFRSHFCQTPCEISEDIWKLRLTNKHPCSNQKASQTTTNHRSRRRNFFFFRSSEFRLDMASVTSLATNLNCAWEQPHQFEMFSF